MTATSDDGEARALTLFAKAGIAADQSRRSSTGWSNEVWLTETHVLRVASRRGPDSLAHELAVASVLPPTVPYPHPVASGWHDDVLWAVAPRVSGQPLSHAWVDAEPDAATLLIDRLAASMRSLHAVELPSSLTAPAPWVDGLPPAGGPPVEVEAMSELVRSFITAALAASAMPTRTADAALATLEDVEDAVSPEPVATVHADLGFDNAIWDGEQVWLVDLEWCCAAPADYELVDLLRYCHDPAGSVEPEWHGRVAAKDHAAVPRLLQRAYPELFAHPRLRHRLLVYGLAGFARGWHWRQDLWRTSVEDADHPSHDLFAFVNGGHWLRLLQ